MLGDLPNRVLLVFLGEQQNYSVAAKLVVIDDRANRTRDIAGRGLAFLGDDFGPELHRRVEQLGPVPELAENGLDADAGPFGDGLERDRGDELLALEVPGGLDDPAPSCIHGLGAVGHRVFAIHFHVNLSTRQIKINVNNN